LRDERRDRRRGIRWNGTLGLRVLKDGGQDAGGIGRLVDAQFGPVPRPNASSLRRSARIGPAFWLNSGSADLGSASDRQ
jgi:hypothetical protein